MAGVMNMKLSDKLIAYDINMACAETWSCETYLEEMTQDAIELEQQIEKMKCCENCLHKFDVPKGLGGDVCGDCDSEFSNWEMKEEKSNEY